LHSMMKAMQIGRRALTRKYIEYRLQNVCYCLNYFHRGIRTTLKTENMLWKRRY